MYGWKKFNNVELNKHADEMKQRIGVAKSIKKNNLIDNDEHKCRRVGNAVRMCVLSFLRLRRG